MVSDATPEQQILQTIVNRIHRFEVDITQLQDDLAQANEFMRYDVAVALAQIRKEVDEMKRVIKTAQERVKVKVEEERGHGDD